MDVRDAHAVLPQQRLEIGKDVLGSKVSGNAMLMMFGGVFRLSPGYFSMPTTARTPSSFSKSSK